MQEAVLHPEKILTAIGVEGTATVADFGCGPGVFAIPVARMTEGTVYAFDVQESVLESVNSQASTHNCGNIVTRRVNLEKEEGSGLEYDSVDFVIMRKIILQNQHKNLLFEEAYRILKPGGTLLVIGWKEGAIIGPAAELRMDADKVCEIAELAGFDDMVEIAVDPHHYGLTFIK